MDSPEAKALCMWMQGAGGGIQSDDVMSSASVNGCLQTHGQACGEKHLKRLKKVGAGENYTPDLICLFQSIN